MIKNGRLVARSREVGLLWPREEIRVAHLRGMQERAAQATSLQPQDKETKEELAVTSLRSRNSQPNSRHSIPDPPSPSFIQEQIPIPNRPSLRSPCSASADSAKGQGCPSSPANTACTVRLPTQMEWVCWNSLRRKPSRPIAIPTTPANNFATKLTLKTGPFVKSLEEVPTQKFILFTEDSHHQLLK